MFLTETYNLGHSEKWMKMCQTSARIYNLGLGKVKHSLSTDNPIRSKSELYRRVRAMKLYCDAKSDLTAQGVQQSLYKALDSWNNYFDGLKSFREDPSAFHSRPKRPQPIRKNKNGIRLFPIFFTNQMLRVKGVKLLAPRVFNLVIKMGRADPDRIRSGHLVPKNGSITFHLVYEGDEMALQPTKRVAAVDTGSKNLFTAVFNTGTAPIIYRGSKLKSLRYKYLQKRKRLQQVYSLQDNVSGKKLYKLHEKTERCIRDELHKTSADFINRCLSLDIDTIVIGRNKGWKQGRQLNSVIRRVFNYLPIKDLIDLVSYKARLKGIRCILHEENYTSKCSFLDLEPVGKQSSYAGNRIHRGQFRSADGTNNWNINFQMVYSSTLMSMQQQTSGVRSFQISSLLILLLSLTLLWCGSTFSIHISGYTQEVSPSFSNGLSSLFSSSPSNKCILLRHYTPRDRGSPFSSLDLPTGKLKTDECLSF